MPGDGYVGAALVAHPQTAGVAFTGSTAVAREINITLAKKEGPIVPLIAETGGQNAMLVDSSALPEQVVDDVILSAFGSAGQRCSSLRILLLQDDIADRVIRLLTGAVAELRLGPPGELSSDIGPVIDEEAYAKLQQHREYLKGFGKLVCEAPLDEALKNQGYFFAPCAWELNNLSGLKNEVFGPILHIVRYRRDELKDIIDQINATGFGLTLGVHTRINAFEQDIVARVRAGNAYVNRSMIGAVVGTQPFGGQGLSGTGPKAGGPHYLPRFATEKVVSINTTAAGGNTTLVSLTE
jgi:RHH-type proline utilization regulon transcriptional repressor/proline dehydrogenase/delta 1-pyrroline-5-carboxylate dehydrogenase